MSTIRDFIYGITSGEKNIFTAPQIGLLTVDDDLSFDLDVTNNFKCTPAADGTLTFTNLASGQSGNIILDNSGGYTISKDATVLADDKFLTTISTAGSYWISYVSTSSEVYVASSGALS